MFNIKQSTALDIAFFAHDVNGDGVTGLVDAGFTKRMKKASGAWGAMAVTITEGENGWYHCQLSTSHTDTTGVLSISFSHASTKRANLQYLVAARINDDFAYPAVSGRSTDTDTSGRLLLQPTQSGVTIPTVTTLTNLPAITANWLTATGINAGALNGKGDWNIGKTGYTLTATTGLGNQTADITGNLTGSVNSVTTDVGITQTGADKVWATTTRQLTSTQTFDNIGTWTGNLTGSVGSVTGLTASNLDATVSSRLSSAGYTAPDNAGITANGAAIAALNDVSVADIWGEALPGSYAVGQAGYYLSLVTAGVSGSSTLNTRATSFTLTTGSETNSYTDTRIADGTHHQLDDTANVIDGYYEFNVGQEGVPVSATALANLQSGNDTMQVFGYNWGGTAWEQVGVLPGTGGASLTEHNWPLFQEMVGTGANLGKVRLRFAILSGGSNPHFDCDLLYVSYSVVANDALFQGTAQAGGASTITFPTTADANDDFYKPGVIVTTSGAGAGQARRILFYDGTTKVATVATPWVVQPSSDTGFKVVAWASVRVSEFDTDVIDSDAVNVTAAAKVADVAWRRTYANIRASGYGDAPSFRSPLGAIAKLVNKWTISGSVLTVYHEDDATSAGTQNVTGTAGADPITTLDTN